MKPKKREWKKLKSFINQAQNNYDIAISDLVYRPGISPLELITLLPSKKSATSLVTSKEMSRENSRTQASSNLAISSFILGAKPENTPAFYNFMNFADFGLGTWHPHKGMYSIVEGMAR